MKALTRLSMHLVVAICIVAIPCVVDAAPAPAMVVTKAGAVHGLAPELADRVSVQLVATVSYYDPADGVLFVQDESGGVYVNTDKPYPIRQGDLVEITGKAHSSYRSEIAMDPEIRVIGQGQKFVGKPFEYQELLAGKGDCEVVTVRGRVLAADVEQHENAPAGHIDLSMPGGEVQVYLRSPMDFHPESLLDATIEVTGVAGGAFDAKYQLTGLILYTADPKLIRVLQLPAVKAQQLPLTDIDGVFNTRDFTDSSPRVRVRGTLTYYKPGTAG